MKRALLILNLFISVLSIAQTEEDILSIPQEMASFPGGEIEMLKFLQNNLRYPQMEKDAGISGTCYLTFVIEKDGSITGIQLLKSIPGGPGCDQEAIRVVTAMPKWIPGKQNGKEIRTRYNLPVKFTLRTTDPGTKTDTIYFSTSWEISSKAEAIFYRIIFKKDKNYLVKDFYMNNLPRMIAECSSIVPLVKNGRCTYFYENGKKQSEGNYDNDVQEGLWTTFYEDATGKDSTIIAFTKGTYKYIHISSIQSKQEDPLDVFYPIEIGAEFTGGEEARQRFIIDHIHYPKKEKDAHITGTSYVTFVVEKDGTLTDIKIRKGVPNGPGYDAEAIRVTRLMPKWKPGMRFGKPVRVQFNQPISFTLLSKDNIAAVTETPAGFPGGNTELMHFVVKNMQYPEKAKAEKRGGVSYITFVVEKDGSLTDVHPYKPMQNGADLDEEAVRIINSMPKWIPGKQNGEEVRVQFNLPIRFTP